MHPVVCMISDRHRLSGEREDALVARVGAAAHAGVHLVQIRERDLDGRALVGLVARCVAAARGTSARVLVNDRLDVALAAAAHGLHLRGESMPAGRVRAVAPPAFLVGRSVHTAGEAVRATDAGGLDYLIFGPIFATTSKPGAVPAGLRVLAEVVAATTLPVIAVGGITEETAPAVVASGAAGFAAIGLFAGRPLSDISPTIARIMRTSPTRRLF